MAFSPSTTFMNLGTLHGHKVTQSFTGHFRPKSHFPRSKAKTQAATGQKRWAQLGKQEQRIRRHSHFVLLALTNVVCRTFTVKAKAAKASRSHPPKQQATQRNLNAMSTDQAGNTNGGGGGGSGGSSGSLEFDGSEGEGHVFDEELDDISPTGGGNGGGSGGGGSNNNNANGSGTSNSNGSGNANASASSLNGMDCLDDTEAMVAHSEILRRSSFDYVTSTMTLPDHYTLRPVQNDDNPNNVVVDYLRWNLSFPTDAIPTYETTCKENGGNILQTNNLQFTYTCDMTEDSKLLFYGGIDHVVENDQSSTIYLTVTKFVTCLASTQPCLGYHNIPFILTKTVFPSLRLENCRNMEEHGTIDTSSERVDDFIISPPSSSNVDDDDLALSDGGFIVVVILGLFFAVTAFILTYRVYWFHQTHGKDTDVDNNDVKLEEFQMTDLQLQDNHNDESGDSNGGGGTHNGASKSASNSTSPIQPTSSSLQHNHNDEHEKEIPTIV